MGRRWPAFISIRFSSPSLSVSDRTACHTEHSAASAASYYTAPHFFISSKRWSLALVDLSLCGTLSDARDQFLSESFGCAGLGLQDKVDPALCSLVYNLTSAHPWLHSVCFSLIRSRTITLRCCGCHTTCVPVSLEGGQWCFLTGSFHSKKSVLQGFKAKQRESFDAVHQCK